MSKSKTIKYAGAVLALVLIAFVAGYAMRGSGAPETGQQAHVEEAEGHTHEAGVNEEGDTVWTCSMHPQIQLPEPGKCPICFMDLIPLKRKDNSGQTSMREISLSDEAQKLAGISVDEVRRMDVTVQTRMVGKVDYDETRVGEITAWAGGRIDRMYVDYTGSVVKKGQPMVSIYSPELLTAQAELVQAVKAIRELKDSNLDLVKQSAARTEKAAREKLRLLGLTKAQVDAVVKSGKPSDHITLYASQGGVVINKNVNEGQYVKTGTSIYSIADLSSVWVVLEAYESDLPWISLGKEVTFQTEAYPGKVFRGKVVYVDPLVNEKSRTVNVRLSVPNKDGSLKPGMLVRATQQTDEGAERKKEDLPLVIPASAPLITGKRAVVYVADKDKAGTYEGREIVLGPRAGNYYIVQSGLEEGEQVVTKGSFKIDSAVQIVAKPSMMNPETPAGAVDAELPDLFLSKLRLLDGTFQKLADTVAAQDLDKTHLAFGEFNKEIRLIDGSSLEGKPALRWREYSMLLSNDAMLGAEAPNVERLNDVFSEMQHHYALLRSFFNLSEQADSPAAPQVFRTAFETVYSHYTDLAGALASDDLSGAKAATAKMAGALKNVDASDLSGPAYNVWTDILGKMNDGIAVIRDAEDLVSARTGLEPISVALTDAVLKLGADTGGPLYQIFCPMAFDYKGAVWLQRDEEIRNPYFGSAMLGCGEVNKQLAK